MKNKLLMLASSSLFGTMQEAQPLLLPGAGNATSGGGAVSDVGSGSIYLGACTFGYLTTTSQPVSAVHHTDLVGVKPPVLDMAGQFKECLALYVRF